MNLKELDSRLRKQKSKKNVSHHGEISETQGSIEESQEKTKITLNSLENSGKISTSFLKNPTNEQKIQYERFVRDILSVGVDGLLCEYNEQLKIYVAKEWKREISDRNLAKNRYKLLVCNDLTRVVLSDGGPGDYIHANHVRINTCKNEFICTQGPILDTRHDFWRMVLQLRSVHIVMLCNVTEDEKNKCEQYWPLKEGEIMQYGDITIRNVKVMELDKHLIKTNLEVRKGNDKYEIRHHHWTTWPDKNIPSSSLAALRILSAIRPSSTPIVVHCSAGIGRTGTIVAIELAIQTLLSTGKLNLLEMCKQLRDCRIRAVEVELQYIYIAQTVIEYGKAMQLCNTNEIMEEYSKFKKKLDTLATTKQLELIAQQVAHVQAEVKRVLGPIIIEKENKKENVPLKEKIPPTLATVATKKTPLLQTAPQAPPLLIPVAPPNLIDTPLKVHVIPSQVQVKPPSSRNIQKPKEEGSFAPKVSNERSAAKKSLRGIVDKERIMN